MIEGGADSHGSAPSFTLELVERVARAIDPEAWASRDKDLSRRDEWERRLKVSWADKTFEQWADRFIGHSLEQARAAIEAMNRADG